MSGSGDLIVTGHFQYTADFGGGVRTSPGSYDIFIVWLWGVEGMTGAGEILARASLGQNLPNPFNPVTRIVFGRLEATLVRLSAYDATGKLVVDRVDDNRGSGRYEVSWPGLDTLGQRVSSGMNFYQLTAGDFAHRRRMILLK